VQYASPPVTTALQEYGNWHPAVDKHVQLPPPPTVVVKLLLLPPVEKMLALAEEEDLEEQKFSYQQTPGMLDWTNMWKR
jgi:hypothetical protein